MGERKKKKEKRRKKNKKRKKSSDVLFMGKERKHFYIQEYSLSQY